MYCVSKRTELDAARAGQCVGSIAVAHSNFAMDQRLVNTNDRPIEYGNFIVTTDLVEIT